MKRINFRNRGLLQTAALGQVLLMVVAGCKSSSNPNEVSIRQAVAGKDSNVIVSTANTVVNGYSALVADAAAGATSITVNALADFRAGTPAKPDVAGGDLLLIIQMAGATIDTTNTEAYGEVSNYNNAGRYELVGVSANPTTNVIALSCPLKNTYLAAGKTQVIRVPQYTTLTVQSGASITAPAWNGTVGGVVAFHAATTLTLTGSVNVNGLGFRGGAIDNNSQDAATDVTLYRSTDDLDGGEKGEGIAGYSTEYTTGRFGRGAPANAGGGGNSHNGGGGGGANATASAADWTGQGVMLNTVVGAINPVTSAWRLDPGYLANTSTLTTSPGGGRGGYTFSANNQDALNMAPGKTPAPDWGGNLRRERGGLGGRPLTSSTGTRLFLGGGGGAGDGNNGPGGTPGTAGAGPGGAGGGLVFVIAETVSGTGNITANGANGGNSNATGPSGDSAGGGGGGGTVVVHANTLSGITLAANGGRGGNQTGITSATEAEGPGGGGGGGYIALSGGTPASVSADGGLGGTTTAAALSEFPTNGATAGNVGVTNASAATLQYCTDSTAPDTTITPSFTSPTRVAIASFTFTSNEPAVSFECRLDSDTGAFTACPATYVTAALASGNHTLDVRARDLTGNADATPAHADWTVDLVAPDTTIAIHPSNPTNVTEGVFGFTSNETGSTFQCAIDGVAFTTCTASTTTPAQTAGSHTLEVRAIDPAGNVDGTPASWTWVVDLTRPNTTITSSPEDPSTTPFGTFSFTSNETGSTFWCSIDGVDFTPCSASYTTPFLDDGEHTLRVRAQDPAGNLDDTPASYSWEVHALGDGGVIEAGVEAGPVDTAPDVTVVVPDASPDTSIKLDTTPLVFLDASPDLTSVDLPFAADRPADTVKLDVSIVREDAQTDAQDGGLFGTLDASDAEKRDALVSRDGLVVFEDAAIKLDQADPSPDTQVVPIPDAAKPTPTPDAAVAAPLGLKLMGSGFCSMNPQHDSTPGLFTFFLLGAFGIMILRRRRR